MAAQVVMGHAGRESVSRPNRIGDLHTETLVFDHLIFGDEQAAARATRNANQFQTALMQQPLRKILFAAGPQPRGRNETWSNSCSFSLTRWAC